MAKGLDIFITIIDADDRGRFGGEDAMQTSHADFTANTYSSKTYIAIKISFPNCKFLNIVKYFIC